MPSLASTTARTGLLSAILAASALVLGPVGARAAAAGGFTAPDDPAVPALIASLKGCLPSLAAADRQVLTLRAGLGGQAPALTARVAAALGETPAAASTGIVVGIRRLEAARRRGACQVTAAAKPAPAAKPAATPATSTSASSASSTDSTTGVLEVVAPVLLVLAFIAGISLELNRRPQR
jgi:hypothetical protein